MLLQFAVDTAQREVAAARTEFDELTTKEPARLEDRRTAARAVVATTGLDVPQRLWLTACTSMGSRSTVAALRSIAANGLGAALIAL